MHFPDTLNEQSERGKRRVKRQQAEDNRLKQQAEDSKQKTAGRRQLTTSMEIPCMAKQGGMGGQFKHQMNDGSGRESGPTVSFPDQKCSITYSQVGLNARYIMGNNWGTNLAQPNLN